MPLSIRDFGTWAPLLALLWAGDQQGLSSPGGYVAGHVDRRGFGWGVPPGQQLPLSGGALPVIAAQIGFDPMAWVQEALADAGMDGISFVAEFSKGGRAHPQASEGDSAQAWRPAVTIPSWSHNVCSVRPARPRRTTAGPRN